MSLLRTWFGNGGQPTLPTGANAAAAYSLGAPEPKGDIVEDTNDPNPDSKQFGMENFGNTCYANSVLQALYFCQPFRDLVCSTPDPFREVFPPPQPPPATPAGAKPTVVAPAAPSEAPPPAATTPPPLPPPPTLFSALRSLYLHISTHHHTKGVVSPASFIAKLKKENELFRGSMHQDAHEFLNFLLNKIVEDLQSEQYAQALDVPEKVSGPQDVDLLADSVASLTPSSTTANARTDRSGSLPAQNGLSANPTLVQTLFEGVLTNETRCLTCETVSSRDESFLDLSIDIEQNSSVTACLRQFSASEMLCQKNKFFCDSCCSLQEAEKRMKIKILPNVLALHLKRFKLLPAEDKYVKLAYRVAFPLELRLFNTVDDAEDPDRLYRLFAIVVHIGGGPHQGHYITIVKSFGNIWRVFDDVTVTTIQESEIPKYFGDASAGAGYVLFYQAADLVPETVGLPPKPAVLAERTNLPAREASPEKAAVPEAVPTSIASSPSTTPSLLPQSETNGHASVRVASPGLMSPPVSVSPSPPSPKRSNFLSAANASPQTPESNGHHISRASTLPPITPVPSTPALVSTPTTSRSSGLFGRIRPPSGVFHPRAPTSSTTHSADQNQPPQASAPVPITPSKGDKEGKDKGTWFSRPKRKDSLQSGLSSSPYSDAGSSSFLPEIKPRSSKRPQTSENTDPTVPPNAPTPETFVRTSSDAPIHRPRTAPGSVPPSPVSPSGRMSFDRSYHPPATPVPPVPPLPDGIASLSPAPDSTHKRRKSVTGGSKFFSRPRTGGGGDTTQLIPPTPTLASSTSQPPSPIISPTPPPRHPRRVASVLPISSPPPPVSLGAAIPRSRPPSSADSHSAATVSSRPESMYVGSSPSVAPLTPVPNPRLAMSTSAAYVEPHHTPPTPAPSSPQVGTPTVSKRASRKMSFTGGGSFFGGWGKDKDKDKDKDRDLHHTYSNGGKLHRESQYLRPPSATPPVPPPKSAAVNGTNGHSP